MGQWLLAVNQHQVIFSYSFSFFLHFFFSRVLSHCDTALVSLLLSTLSKHIKPFPLYFFSTFFPPFSSLLDSLFFSPLSEHVKLSPLWFSLFFPPFLFSIGLFIFSPFSEHIKPSPLCFSPFSLLCWTLCLQQLSLFSNSLLHSIFRV